MADELLARQLAGSGDPVLAPSKWATGLNVSEATIQTWIKTRKLIGYSLFSGRYIIKRTSLKGLILHDTLELAQKKILELEQISSKERSEER